MIMIQSKMKVRTDSHVGNSVLHLQKNIEKKPTSTSRSLDFPGARCRLGVVPIILSPGASQNGKVSATHYDRRCIRKLEVFRVMKEEACRYGFLQ